MNLLDKLDKIFVRLIKMKDKDKWDKMKVIEIGFILREEVNK